MDLIPRAKSAAARTETLSLQLFMVAIVCMVISPGIVVAKLLGRSGVRCVKARVEESSIIFAGCFSVALSILLMIVSQSGFDGAAGYTLISERIYPNYVGSQSCYRAASSLGKLAIIIQCMQNYKQFWEFVLSGVVITAMIAEAIICIAITLFGGTSRFNGSGYLTSTHGTIVESFLAFDGALTVGFNAAMILLMIPAFRRIKFDQSPKFTLCISTALGVLMVTTSVQRMLTFRALEPMETPAILGILSAALWSVLEANFTVACACMPGLWNDHDRPLRPRRNRPRRSTTAQASDIELQPIRIRTTRARTS